MTVVNAQPANARYYAHIRARLADFFEPDTVWQRRLWALGTTLLLREALEGAQAVQAGVLSEPAFRFLWDEAVTAVGKDPAARQWHGTLKNLLHEKTRLIEGGFRYEIVEHVLAEIESGYLERWADAISRPVEEHPGPERAARAVAAHLLDCGLHPRFLAGWLKATVIGTPAFPEVIRTAAKLRQEMTRDYRVLVPLFTRLPNSIGSPSNWVSAQDVAAELRQLGGEQIRQRGGLRFTVTAPDQFSAVENVFELVERTSARLQIGAAFELRPAKFAIVDGFRGRFDFRRDPRGVEVGALLRNRKLFIDGEVSALDSALELLAPLDSGPVGPAIAGGWSAIETLLYGLGDGEKVPAADRLAALVACSFPRAELTTLSYGFEKGSHESLPLARRLKSAGTNELRSRILAEAIHAGEDLTLDDLSDQAALSRVTQIPRDPKPRLADVEQHARAAIRRLYRQRNLVLHWGRVTGVAVRACLRTAAPLVGAGIDRVAHAALIHRTRPLELAARARLRLDYVASERRSTLTDLLE